MAKTNTKKGDLFSIKLGDDRIKYFQYVGNDLTQLNSEVIRVFKKTYSFNSVPDHSEIVKSEVDFYAHCVIKWGIKLGYWEKVGNIQSVESISVLFRSSGDEPQTKVSRDWWVWTINEEQKYVGKLEGEHQKAEIGSVIPPDSIVHRIQTGKYDFVYPSF